MSGEAEILQGAIAGILFRNEENGYAVLRLSCDDGQTVTVVGTVPQPAMGERLMVTGKWSTHANYGKQFEAEFLERLMPRTDGEILRYLSSRVIKGVGPKTAARIVRKFGEETLRIMDTEPERLAEVPGISLAKAKAIGENFRMLVGVRHILEFFTLHRLPADLAVRTYKMYGESTVELLYDDPYLLMEQGLEAPFGAVDRFAVDLGIAADDPRRLEAGLIFELHYNESAGHSFLPEDKLVAATAQLLTVDPSEVRQRLNDLREQEKLVCDRLADITVYYLPELYQAERECTRRLQALARTKYPAPRNLDAMVRRASGGALEFSQGQKQAVAQAATGGLMLITGGPGTGKTTILTGILSLFDEMKLDYVLAAPTGRAAKRLTEVTGREASTIHRLLEAGIDPHSGDLFFAKDEASPLKTHAVIVDEMSMVDIRLLHHLLAAVPANARVIFVGDADQLPPVGPGFPFSDMLRSKSLPTVELTEIFRQARESLIVTNAHRVNKGELPELRDVKHDFFFLPARSEEELSKTVVDLCVRRLPQNMGIPADQIQVLSPTRKGAAGTGELNRLLQAALNPPAPGKAEKKYGELLLRTGDRVIQVKNNYDLLWRKTDSTFIGAGVFNGDIGRITEIDSQEETLTVVFDDDKEVTYDFTQLNELELAYALTVHKSQGSEYRAVVMVTWNGSPYLMNRSILYTGITRARELLILAGNPQTVAAMTANAKVNRRYTGMKLRLQEKV